MTEFRPDDWQARQRALDPTTSFIVQAPAGSGKTELLIQRILGLLGQSRRPEEVLAITFTRKAALEMRQRLLESLEAAAEGATTDDPHRQPTRRLAFRVLQQDRLHGWDLLSNPTRLQVQTIDSLCAALVRQMPWLSRFGAPPEVSDEASALYRQAAGRMVEKVRRGGSGAAQVETLLRHLDNRLDILRDLLADMLAKRDQWLRHLLGHDHQSARNLLEQGLKSYIRSQIGTVVGIIPPEVAEKLPLLLRYAAGNLLAAGDERLSWYADHGELPPEVPEALDAWCDTVDVLLNKAGSPRRRADVRLGFPSAKDGGDPEKKQAFESLLGVLAEHPQLCCALQRLRELPRPAYSEEEWRLLDSLVTLLPLTVVELDSLFREQGTSDFIAVAAAARAALADDEAPADLLIQLDSRLEHILVDEFQDTSYGQYVLLQQLTSGWTPGDGRTLFVVGDPMQSIYRFREAEVGLFLRARRYGLGTVVLEPLQLSANFRSHPALVDWFNRTFSQLFPALEDEARGAVTFSAASTLAHTESPAPVQICALPARDDACEAATIVQLIRRARAENPERTIAVLVRSRNHAEPIVTGLADAGLRFQARDLVSLKNRSVVQDLLALTRALLHHGDRVAWLSVLRAPWCGLALDDLLSLVADDARSPVFELMQIEGRQEDLFSPLTPDQVRRLERMGQILHEALGRRGRVGLRSLVESTWLALGGPACCDAAELADARQFFRLLDRLDDGGDLARLADLDEALEELYAAPDPLADERLQVMTVHKAKGLEFDTVVLPGLGRATRGRDRALLRWLEHPEHQLLLAPIPAADGSGTGETYAAIGKMLKDKEDLEVVRLLYVGVTRAKHELILSGHLNLNTAGDFLPPSGSLLAAGWPSLQAEFLGCLEAAGPAEDQPGAAPIRQLRRLPVDYRLPDWPGSPEFFRHQLGAASEISSRPEVFSLQQQSGDARVVGDTVHSWFERHAGTQTLRREDARRGEIRNQLASRGIPKKRLEACVAKVLAAIDQALAGEKGRWILKAHREQACELPLAGILDNRLVHAKIDRTFVGEDGTRWVIDYKTAVPAKGQSRDDFLRQQAQLHASQLAAYRKLMQAYDPRRAIRTALYFPLFDGWLELTHDDP